MGGLTPAEVGIMGCTHFVSEGPEYHRAFAVEDCEICGKPSSTGGVNILEPKAVLLRFGMTELEVEPPEMYWCEEEGCAACFPCCDAAARAAEGPQD